MRRMFIVTAGLVLAGVAVGASLATRQPATPPLSAAPETSWSMTPEDDAFLEDLEKRTFMFFWEQADPKTGIVRDRAGTNGGPPANERAREVGSIASVGFGLSGMCIAAERGWLPRDQVVERTRATLRFFAEKAFTDHGWFYHFINLRTGEREWQSEISTIDTALLVAGVLTAKQCFKDDEEIGRHADTIYRRLDFPWTLNGHPTLPSMGYRPETGFIKARWDHYSEHIILYVLGLGSPTKPLPAESWAAWRRPIFTYGPYTYVNTIPPLFIHQFSHAWVDLRSWRDPVPPQPDWFTNSIIATYAQRRFMMDLSKEFPGYSESVWGLTSSDSRTGYKAWGGPPRDKQIDGTVVPCAPAGSLMFAPEITLPALREMHRRFGDRIYGRYGFADAFHPTEDWVNPDVIGIDLGITLLSAENLRSGRVWQWFMANPEIVAGMKRTGMTPITARKR